MLPMAACGGRDPANKPATGESVIGVYTRGLSRSEIELEFREGRKHDLAGDLREMSAAEQERTIANIVGEAKQMAPFLDIRLEVRSDGTFVQNDGAEGVLRGEWRTRQGPNMQTLLTLEYDVRDVPLVGGKKKRREVTVEGDRLHLFSAESKAWDVWLKRTLPLR
jgi:hypothetical protein